MDYDNIVKTAQMEIPEFAKAYDLEFEKDNIDLDSGPHTVFSFVFVPLLEKAISDGNRDLAQRLCGFLEKMECSGNSDVAEVVEFTVLEELCDDYRDADFKEYLLPETKLALQAIREYIVE